MNTNYLLYQGELEYLCRQQFSPFYGCPPHQHQKRDAFVYLQTITLIVTTYREWNVKVPCVSSS